MPLNCDSPCLGTAVKASEVADLEYLEGVDVVGCWKFENPAHLVCRVFATLPTNGNAVPGTTLVVGSDCKTYGIAPETPNAAIDSPSVDITLSGILNRTIRADVKRSATAGNQIVENGDGLFVAPFNLCPFVAAVPDSVSPLVFGTTRLVGKDCQAYTVEETPVIANDTQSINLAGSGLFNHTLQADIILDPSANNLAVIGAPGLLVQETTFIPATTPTIQSTVGGVHGHSPIYAVRVSATAGNQIAINADGIYVGAGAGETPLTANDSTTIDFTTSGTANHTVTATVIVSPSAGNALQATGSGLFVPPGASFNLCAALSALPAGAQGVYGTDSYIGPDCQTHLLPVPISGSETAWTGTSASSPVLTIVPGGVSGHAPVFHFNLSTNVGNALQIDGTGLLFAPTPCFIGGLATPTIGNPLELLGLNASNCMVRKPLCDIFFALPTTPQAVGGYEVIVRNSGTGCLTAQPPRFTVVDNFGTIGSVNLGLTSPQGQLSIIGQTDQGLGTFGVASGPNGSYTVNIGVVPCNGWDTLLGVVSAGTITHAVGIDSGGCLAQYVPPSALTETTFAATSGNAALVITPGGTAGHNPLFAVTLSAAVENITTIDGAGLYTRKPNTFGSQHTVGAQANDGAAIAALNALVGMVGGEHATVVVGGVFEVFFYTGAAWIRAY